MSFRWTAQTRPAPPPVAGPVAGPCPMRLAANPTAQETWDACAPTVPLGVGWLQPEEVSLVAVFLASDAAALVTGAEFAVTGGDAARVS